MYYVLFCLSVHPPHEVEALWLVVLTVFLAPGIQVGPQNVVEYVSGAHFNLVPTSVYSSAFKLSLDTT